MTHNKRLSRIVAALTLALLGTAAAAPIITGVNSANELAYTGDVSSTDLLRSLTPTTTGWNLGNGATLAQLNDGIHGVSYAAAGNKVQGAWTTVGATATYNLGLGPAGTGWNLTSIQTIAAWVNAGFGNQAYTVEVKLKSAASYTTLATVNYQPLGATSGGATKVSLTDAGGVLANGVEFIRFTANSVNAGANAGAFVMREIDVTAQAPGPDVTAPQVLSLSPADGVGGVSVGTNLVMTFDENIALGTGAITLKNLSDSTQTVIPVNSAQVVVAGSVLTIRPSPSLAAPRNYAICVDSTAVKDLSGNAFGGFADDTSWNFTTLQPRLRIMALGDSITAGYTDNPYWTNHQFMFGYRSGLYTRLNNAGYSFLFVGGSTEPWTGISGDPTHGGTYTPAFDLRPLGQDGHRGYGGKDASFLQTGIEGWLTSDNPDIILLKIGTNSQNTSALDTLVNTIVTKQPNAHLIIAEIIPKTSYQAGIVSYNTYIRDTLVPKLQAQGKHVTRVDQYVNFLTNPADLTSINQALFSNAINHPTNAAYDKMAQTWFTAIEALGLRSDYAAWSGKYPDLNLSDPTADADGDGLSNGIEAWFGTHPGQWNVGVFDLATSGLSSIFSHPQNPSPPTDLSGFYQWSPNLADWYASGSGPGGGPTVTMVPTTVGTITTVTATASGVFSSLFLRVGATRIAR